MINISKKSYFHFIIYMIIITTYFPLVYNNLPFPLRSFKFFWGPLWLLSFFIFTKYLNNRFIISFIIYASLFVFILPSVLWINMNPWYYEYNIQEEIYVYAIGITLFIYLRNEKEFLFWARISQLTLFLMGITAVMTLVSARLDPMYARYLAGGSGFEQDSPQGLLFMHLGGAQYSYGQAIAYIFPVIMFYYRYNRYSIFSRTIIALYIILLYLSVLKMQFFANIIVATFVIILSLLRAKHIKISLLFIFLLGTLIIIIPDETYKRTFLYLSGFFPPNSENHLKLVDLANYFTSGGLFDESTIFGNRTARYPELFEAFIHKPLFGDFSYHSPYDIEGAFHLYLGARLATLGLIAFLLYLWLHYSLIKRNIKMFNHSLYLFYYLISIGGFILLSLMKHIVGREVWLTYFILLPGLYFLPKLNYLRKNKK